VRCAATALGIDRRPTRKAIAVPIIIETKDDNCVSAIALLDSGAEANFIDQRWAIKHLAETDELPRRVSALDGHYITSYGKHHVTISAIDRNGESRAFRQPCEAVDLTGYDLVLGWD
jgi:hypothetical protein